MDNITNSLEETQTLAAEWLSSLGDQVAKSNAATVVGLVGDLGSGKTSFVQGVAKALGVQEHVTSPTFILERIYKLGPLSAKWKHLVHIDAYRLEGSDELKHLGWEDLTKDPGSLILVEWPERVGLKQDLYLNFEFINEQTRKITT